MAWQDDLYALLTEVDPNPVEDILGSAVARPVIGALASQPAQTLFNALDQPLSASKYGMGAIVGGINEGLGLLPGQPGFEPGTSEALHAGGPRAAWEEMRADQPMWFQAPTEIAMDPLNLIGAGGGSRIAAGAREAANIYRAADRPILAAAMEGTGTFATGAQRINDLPGNVLLPPTQAAVRGVKRGIERVSPKAFELEQLSARRVEDDAIKNAWVERESRRGQPPPQMPAVAPIMSTPHPPIPPHPHPPGSAPALAYQTMGERWRSYWAKMGNPTLGIASIDTVAGQPKWRQPKDVELTPELIDEMAGIGVGLMMTVADSNGLFPSLTRASAGMRQIQEELVAKHGVGIQPFLPTIHSRMRERMIAEGNDPDKYLPSSRFLLPWGWSEELIKTKRLEAANQAVGRRVKPVSRKAALKKMEAYPQGAEVVEAAAQMGAGMLSLFRNSPDETFHQFTPGGAYFPQAPVGKPNAVAALPGRVRARRDDFRRDLWGEGEEPGPMSFDLSEAGQLWGVTQPFGSTREAWNSYMRTTFGELADDELDTLARMSSDMLYNHYVNAANTYSGGSGGAKVLARAYDPKTREINPQRLRSIIKKGPKRGQPGEIPEERRKIGAYARGPQDFGSPEAQAFIRSRDVPGGGLEFDRMSGRLSELSLWQEQAKEALGQTTPITQRQIGDAIPRWKSNKTGAPTGEMLQDYLMHLGVAPFQPNPLGGPLPTLSQLAEKWTTGSGLNVGGGPAKTWYTRAMREIESIVGRGNYEDAVFLLNAIGITSTATEVSRNAEFALRALAEWKFGYDDTLRSFGLRGADLTTLREGGLLRGDMLQNQSNLLTDLVNQFVSLRENAGQIPKNLQGGPKTHNYAGSFLVNLWRDQFDQMKNSGSAIVEQAKKDFDEALAIYTVDRHDSRISNLGTAVTSGESFFGRERGILSAKNIAVSGEAMQGAGWYWARDAQGFMREIRPESDIAMALRDTVRRLWDDSEAGAMESFDQIVLRFADEGMQPEDALANAYDLVKQEVLYRALDRSFRRVAEKAARDKIPNPLTARGLPSSIEELRDDTLGIVARGATGIAPEEGAHPLRETAGIISQPTGLYPEGAAQPLGVPTAPGGLFDVARGLPEAMVWDGSAWKVAPPEPTTPLRTGPAFDPSKPIAAERALGKLIANSEVDELFDPVLSHGAAEELRIVLVPDGAKMRWAIAVPGQLSPRGRSLRAQLESVIGPLARRPAASAEQVRKRGATMAELDLLNPLSLWQRKVVNPIMARYAESTLREGVSELTGAPDIGELDLPEWPDTAAMSYTGDPLDQAISLNANNTLNTKLKDGTSYRQFIASRIPEIERDMTELKASGATWHPHANLADRKRAANGNAKIEALITKWHKEGIDPLYVDTPDDAAIAMLSRQIDKDLGITRERATLGALLMAAWGEQVLLTPKYLMGNLQGNWLANALQGVGPEVNPFQYLAAFKRNRGGLDTVTRTEARDAMKATQIARTWGLSEAPAQLGRGGVKDFASNEARIHGTATGELVGRLTGSPRAARAAGWLFQLNNDLARAIDETGRGTIWGDRFDAYMREDMRTWEAEVHRRAQGIAGFEFSVLESINLPQGGLFFEDIRDNFVKLGLQDGVAERLARDFNEIRGRNKGRAIGEMHKTQFSYDRTNLDAFVGRFIPFHYWMSRAVRYYGEEAIRNPGLAMAYFRAADGIEDAQNDPGLSARQKGFLRLMGTPIGFSLLMNPDSLFGVVQIFNLNESYEPDGQTSLGGAINWMKERGIGLYPWIDGTLNLMGIYGNTFEPDLLGIRHKTLAGAAINFVRAHAGFDPATAPYADAMGQARYAVSSFVSSFTPDWLSQPVTPRAGGSTQEASLDTVIETIVIENNPNLTNEELLGIMADPDHPEFERAYQQASDAGLIQQLLNMALPQTYRMRHDARDVRTAQITTIAERANELGKAPFEFQPTLNDLDFRARYKALTGNEWQPGDYEDATFKHDLSRAPAEAKAFIVDEAAWRTLGGPRAAKNFATYQAIRNGSDERTKALPEATRHELAETWVDRHGAAADIERVYMLRGEFETAHPEFGEFKAWQDAMFGLREQLGGDLGEYRRQAGQQNPNAARFFEDRWAWITQTFKADEWEARLDSATTSAAAFHAITGKGTNRMSQGPFPGVPPADITLPGMLATGQGPAPPMGTDWGEEYASVARAHGATLF